MTEDIDIILGNVARREALLFVTESPLRKLRDDCIDELNQDIQIFINAAQSMK